MLKILLIGPPLLYTRARVHVKEARVTKRNLLGFNLLISLYHTNKFQESFAFVKSEETKLGNRKYAHTYSFVSTSCMFFSIA